jgi:hypothetical protein
MTQSSDSTNRLVGAGDYLAANPEFAAALEVDVDEAALEAGISEFLADQ